MPSVLPLARWVLFTDRAIAERNLARFDPGIPCRWIQNTAEIEDEPALFIRDLAGDVSSIEWGRLSAEAGRRSLAYLQAASDEALAGKLIAIVTAPVNKEA